MSDAIEFPEAWLWALHPRRSGRRAPDYVLPPAMMVDDQRWRAAHEADVDELLLHPDNDPRLVALVRSGAATDEAVAAELAVEAWSAAKLWVVAEASPYARAERRVQQLGLVDAAAAYVRSHTAGVVYAHQFGGRDNRGHVLTTEEEAARRGIMYHRVRREEFTHLRHLLARTDETTWRAAVRRLAPYRSGSRWQRVATTYLLPDCREWVEADVADRATMSTDDGWFDDMIRFGAFRPEHITWPLPSDLGSLVTVVDALGHDAVPALVRSLDWHIEHQDRDEILSVLSQLGGREVLAALVRRARLTDTPAIFEQCATREPILACDVLADHSHLPFTSTLITRLAQRCPGSGTSASRPPAAPPGRLPAALTVAPRAAKMPPKLAVAAASTAVELDWLPHERERWHWDMWPTFEPTHYDNAVSEGLSEARFYLGGSAAAVRPRLATWRAEESSFYLENPRLLVAKYELDAYLPALRLARAKPAVGALLLAPFRSAEVAELMAKWLVTSRQWRSLAREWFDRHETAGVALLLPVAFAGGGTSSRVAFRAVAMLDPDTVKAAADDLDCRAAVETHLLTPTALLPARVPAVPSWFEPGALPPVLTRDRAHSLGDAPLKILCRLLASSRPGDEHPDLAAAVAALDQKSVSEFAWQVFGSWHVVGRPSRDAWALDVLGLVGDDAIADRLAALVRVWPHDGAAGRAKRGAEALAAMPGASALRHLSALARNAKSTPLRTHCLRLLDDVAAERGLLPEQLADALAPDVGLDDLIDYRGEIYRPSLGRTAELVLRSADGTSHTTLPKPIDDGERSVVSGWRRQRRLAGAAIASEVDRLEQAMIEQRLWGRAEFASALVTHPLLNLLARRLVWEMGGTTVVLNEDGDLVAADGRVVTAGDWVRLAHPATDDLRPWRTWHDSADFDQPFAQIDREVFDDHPSALWNVTVAATALASLLRDGWHWGTTGQAARRTDLFRPLTSGSSVTLRFEPGVSAVEDLASQPDQLITQLSVRGGEHGELSVFGDLPRVTRSELARELSTLTPRG